MKKTPSIIIALLLFTGLLVVPLAVVHAVEPRDAEEETSEIKNDAIEQKTAAEKQKEKAIEAEKIKYSGRFDLNALRLHNTADSEGKLLGEEGTQGSSFIDRAKAEGISPITAIILEATEFLTKVVGSVAFLLLIVSGLWMIVSLGNEQQVTRAKSIFTWAILGITLALGAYMIVIFVQGLLVE